MRNTKVEGSASRHTSGHLLPGREQPSDAQALGRLRALQQPARAQRDGRSPWETPSVSPVDPGPPPPSEHQSLPAGPVCKVTAMAFYALQIAGLVLGLLGVAGALGATLLPQWRVSAFVGSNIIVFERIWEGLWMTCVRQATATLQCKVYSSLLALPPALEAARALMCVAVALALLALLVGVCSAKGVQCAGSSERAKAHLLGASGALFLLAGASVLIPVCWTAHTIIRDFHNPAVHAAQKRELGAALFLGWAGATVLFLAGGLLCGVCCCARKGRGRRRPAPGPCAPHADTRRNGATAHGTATSYV